MTQETIRRGLLPREEGGHGGQLGMHANFGTDEDICVMPICSLRFLCDFHGSLTMIRGSQAAFMINSLT